MRHVGGRAFLSCHDACEAHARLEVGPHNMHDGGPGSAFYAYMLQICTSPQQLYALNGQESVEISSSLPFLRLSLYSWSKVCCVTVSQ